MWFFFAVLTLWGTTAILGRQDDWNLPPLVLWSWWTASLYLCGTAAITETYTTLQARLMGLFGFTLFAVYYSTQHSAYLALLPSDTASPELWPTVFVAVNLLGPILLVSAGCLRATVQRGR